MQGVPNMSGSPLCHKNIPRTREISSNLFFETRWKCIPSPTIIGGLSLGFSVVGAISGTIFWSSGLPNHLNHSTIYCRYPSTSLTFRMRLAGLIVFLWWRSVLGSEFTPEICLQYNILHPKHAVEQVGTETGQIQFQPDEDNQIMTVKLLQEWGDAVKLTSQPLSTSKFEFVLQFSLNSDASSWNQNPNKNPVLALSLLSGLNQFNPEQPQFPKGDAQNKWVSIAFEPIMNRSSDIHRLIVYKGPSGQKEVPLQVVKGKLKTLRFRFNKNELSIFDMSEVPLFPVKNNVGALTYPGKDGHWFGTTIHMEHPYDAGRHLLTVGNLELPKKGVLGLTAYAGEKSKGLIAEPMSFEIRFVTVISLDPKMRNTVVFKEEIKEERKAENSVNTGTRDEEKVEMLQDDLVRLIQAASEYQATVVPMQERNRLGLMHLAAQFESIHTLLDYYQNLAFKSNRASSVLHTLQSFTSAANSVHDKIMQDHLELNSLTERVERMGTLSDDFQDEHEYQLFLLSNTDRNMLLTVAVFHGVTLCLACMGVAALVYFFMWIYNRFQDWESRPIL